MAPNSKHIHMWPKSYREWSTEIWGDQQFQWRNCRECSFEVLATLRLFRLSKDFYFNQLKCRGLSDANSCKVSAHIWSRTCRGRCHFDWLKISHRDGHCLHHNLWCYKSRALDNWYRLDSTLMLCSLCLQLSQTSLGQSTSAIEFARRLSNEAAHRIGQRYMNLWFFG